jgi:hypothetical protein
MSTVMVNPAGPAVSSAVDGMADASRRYDVAAHNIANVSTDPFSPLQPDGSHGAAAAALDASSRPASSIPPATGGRSRSAHPLIRRASARVQHARMLLSA